MLKTEKITINMNVVDLGKADILVEQGFYSNRTDFIKTSIRNQLTNHAKVLDKVITETSHIIGVIKYTRKELERLLEENKQLDIKVVGMLSLANDIDEELALKTISSIRVAGVFRASNKVKEALKDIRK